MKPIACPPPSTARSSVAFGRYAATSASIARRSSDVRKSCVATTARRQMSRTVGPSAGVDLRIFLTRTASKLPPLGVHRVTRGVRRAGPGCFRTTEYSRLWFLSRLLVQRSYRDNHDPAASTRRCKRATAAGVRHGCPTPITHESKVVGQFTTGGSQSLSLPPRRSWHPACLSSNRSRRCLLCQV